MKLATNKICRPCIKSDSQIMQVLKEQTDIKDEFKVDRILKKLKVLEGIIKENILKQSELEWAQAYDKYSIFRP